MIKGNSRHVIVIKNPDGRYFDEAIFIVKRGLFCSTGKTEEEIMEEAREAAEGYLKKMKSEDLIYR